MDRLGWGKEGREGLRNRACRRAGCVASRSLTQAARLPCVPVQVIDIAAISAMAKAVGAIVCVDNSIMAPVFQVGAMSFAAVLSPHLCRALVAA